MPGYPPYVSGAPEHIFVLYVEDIFHSQGRVEKITGSGVQNPLWLARAAAGVEDEQGILRVHHLRLAEGRGLCHKFMPPVITALFHGSLFIYPVDHDTVLDAVSFLKGGVRVSLGREDLA